MKLIKYTIYAVLVLLALVVAAGAVFVMTFDPNRYKGDIERIVQERTGRTLKLSGDLAVAVWPSLGAKVGPERPIARIHARTPEAAQAAADAIRAAVRIADAAPAVLPTIVDRVRA